VPQKKQITTFCPGALPGIPVAGPKFATGAELPQQLIGIVAIVLPSSYCSVYQGDIYCYAGGKTTAMLGIEGIHKVDGL
jgi:hypothetical protein